jgi:hypothetical protein
VKYADFQQANERTQTATLIWLHGMRQEKTALILCVRIALPHVELRESSHTNLAHFRKIKAAAEQRGVFGDVRRAIAAARRPLDDLAHEIGVDPRLLSDFRAGDAELPSASLDRLIEVLGLRLMREIAR